MAVEEVRVFDTCLLYVKCYFQFRNSLSKFLMQRRMKYIRFSKVTLYTYICATILTVLLIAIDYIAKTPEGLCEFATPFQNPFLTISCRISPLDVIHVTDSWHFVFHRHHPCFCSRSGKRFVMDFKQDAINQFIFLSLQIYICLPTTCLRNKRGVTLWPMHETSIALWTTSVTQTRQRMRIHCHKVTNRTQPRPSGVWGEVECVLWSWQPHNKYWAILHKYERDYLSADFSWTKDCNRTYLARNMYGNFLQFKLC